MQKRLYALFASLLILGGWFVWRGTLNNQFLYDDDTFVVLNKSIRSLTPPLKFFSPDSSSHDAQMNHDVWRPLTTFSYALNYRISGLNPRSFHLANVVLHIINGLLIFWLALMVLRGGDGAVVPGPGNFRYIPAFIAALVFLIHPMQTETVAWVSQRSSLLSLSFFLLSFIAYLGATGGRRLSRRSAGLYLLSLAVFCLALLSKEMSASLPIILWGYEYFVNREKSVKAAFIVSPFAAIVIFFMMARSLALGQTAQTVYWAGGPVPQLLTMIKGFAYYVKLTFLPYPLSVEYLFPVKQKLDAELLGYLAMFAGLGWAAWKLKAKYPAASFGIFLFFAALGPVSNIIPIRTIINERFLYFSIFGFGLAAGCLAQAAARRFSGTSFLSSAYLPLAAASVFLLYAYVSMARNLDWFDHYSFVTANLKTCPQSATLHYGMGRAYASKGLFDKASDEFELALKIDPQYAQAMADIGRRAAKKGDNNEAISRYRESVQKKVDYFEGLHNLGIAYFNKKDYKNAVKALEKAVAIRPADLEARHNLAAAYAYSGDLRKGVEMCRAIIAAAPNMARTRKNLALFESALARQYPTPPAGLPVSAFIKNNFRYDVVGGKLASASADYVKVSTAGWYETAPGYMGSAQPREALKPEEARALAAFAANRGGVADALVFSMAPSYNGGYKINYRGAEINLKPVRGASAAGHVEDGGIGYAAAEKGTDVFYAVYPGGGFEQLLVLRNKNAPVEFQWEMTVSSGAVPVLNTDGTLGAAGLSLSRPLVFDSAGKTAGGIWELKSSSAAAENKYLLAMRFDSTGLKYPLLIDPAWAAAGSMSAGRISHTATLLPNGKVLMAGGLNDIAYLSSADIYDPSSGTWSTTAPMNTLRAVHTATLLPNGKVLVAGGSSGTSTYLSTSQLYDPSTGAWSTTGSLSTMRSSHTATLLPNGKVLVVGGGNAGGKLSTAELYDPASGTWATTNAMNTARYGHTATLLPNGKVLVAGGSNGAVVYSTAQLYDPSTGTWATTNAMSTGRYCHTATLLPNGKVLVTGGTADGTNALSTAQLYDPSAGTWATTNAMSTTRMFHVATLLPNGNVLVAGGYGSAGLVTAALYSTSAGTWSATGSMSTDRDSGHTATLLPSGDVLVAGGMDSASTGIANAQLYSPATGSFSATGSMAVGRLRHTSTLLPNGKVLLAGGTDNVSVSLSTAELYDPASGTWATTGSMLTPRAFHTATLLPSGKVLIAGGKASTMLYDCELYDPAAGTFSATGRMADTRSEHAATLMMNGQVLITGGTSATGPLSTAELYDPASGTFTTTGSMSTVRKRQTSTLLPNGKVLVSGGFTTASLSTAELYNPAAGTFSTTGSMSTARCWHTSTLLPNGTVLVAGGTAAAAVSTAELYNPAAGTFAATGGMAGGVRYLHAATLLPSGKVLISGGTTGAAYLSTVILYDPGVKTFSTTGAMSTARYNHTSILLPNGKVLVAAGTDATNALSTAQLARYTEYDYSVVASTMQPSISTVGGSSSFPVKILSGASYTLGGARFKGYSEGSSGQGQSSPANYPRVYMSKLDSGYSMVGDKVLVDISTSVYPISDWSGADTTITFTAPPSGLPYGYYMLYVIANAIPSDAVIVKYCLGASYATKIGVPGSWTWGTPDYCDAPSVPSGTSDTWQWRGWTPGSGRKVPQGGASSWTWGNE